MWLCATAQLVPQLQEAAARKAQEAAFVPEEEEEEEERPAHAAAQASSIPLTEPSTALPPVSASQPTAPVADAAAAASQPERQPGREVSTDLKLSPPQLQNQQLQQQAEAEPQSLRPGLNPQRRPKTSSEVAVPQKQSSQQQLMADLAVLRGVQEASNNGDVDEGDLSAWKPPTGQSGDGRTALNEQLGY